MDIDSEEIVKEIRKVWGELVTGINETFEFGKKAHEFVFAPKSETSSLVNFMSSHGEQQKELIDALKNEISQIQSFRGILNKMMLVNGVSHFEAFFKDLISLVFRINYRSLTNSDKKTVSYKSIFQHSNQFALLQHLIDIEILELSYKSISDQFKEIENKYNFSINKIIEEKKYPILEQFKLDLDRLSEIFATRNILLHNRGIVNEKYLNSSKNSSFQMGELRPLDEDYISKSLEYLLIFGTELYIYSTKKYGNKDA